jgi:predicted acetyltransferase
MSFETREAGQDLARAWRGVVEAVYRNRPTDEPFEPARNGEKRYLTLRDGLPAAACSVTRSTLARNDKDLSCGCVAVVATLPEHRRAGAASHLMTDVLAAMQEEGVATSALYAFREPFYRKFGYATCGWRWQIKCPAHRLPKIEGELPVRQVAAEDSPSLDPVYTSFVRARSGSFLRSESDWKDRLGKRPPSIYAFGEPAEAYLWVNLSDFWGEAMVGEVAWTSSRGHASVLAFFSGIAASQSSVTWCEPRDGLFVPGYLDQGIPVALHRPTMFRLVDLPLALAPFMSGDEGLVLRVSDEVAPWNQGLWRLGGSVERVASDDPDAEMDIDVLAQLVIGECSAWQLASVGLLKVASDEVVSRLDRLFSPASVVCMDFF